MKHSRKRILTTHTGSLPRPPELVADRIPNHANIVGGENVIAGVDCGGAGERTYRKGDSLVEAFRDPASRPQWRQGRSENPRRLCRRSGGAEYGVGGIVISRRATAIARHAQIPLD